MEEQKLIKRKRKALSDGNKTLLITVCIQLAELYFKEGRYLQAINEYKIVADKYKDADKRLDYARANRMIGEGYSHLQKYDKALQHQRIHLDVARTEKDELEEQRALATIGHTYLTSYLDIVDNPNKTALNLAYKSFMKSLIVCEKLTGISKREHMDMSARLFANLGVVQECLGNYDKGIELVQKSIDICKAHDIYEQLERGYVMLGSLYAKKEDYGNGIHQYNLAVEVASRLEDKIALVSSALSSKADILIKLSDFYGAKTVLLKAYKLKNPNITEHSNIERTLKIVATMCYTEDSLLTTSITDYKTRKKLYEKMGDGASSLRNYPKAIEYYRKMLESAMNDGDSGKDLCPCYISLAQCYSDNKQYDLAIEYFRKEYDVNKATAKESVSTLFSIVDAMELAGRPMIDKEEIYKLALSHCRDDGDSHLEGKTLIRYINLLRKNKSDLHSLERELTELGYESTGSESEEETTPDIGVDLCVDDITDVSDVSDSERDLNKPRATRKRNKGFVIKRNNKGETQLHTACISGNVTLVRRLLDQGHTVNVRDNCGWLPIHEACICGYVEIVELLLNKGASINDRGGTLCNGMTPLHDAASNGHLEVIQLLLDRGANATVKTDEGASPLQTLRSWRKRVQLDPIRQSFYEVILERMMQALEVSGHDFVADNKENVALVRDIVDEESPSIDRPTSSIVHSDESSSDVSTSTSSADCNGRNDYKEVMLTLRHRIAENTTTRETFNVAKRPALLEPNEVGDDWLEDDVRTNTCKKQKVGGAALAYVRKSSDVEDVNLPSVNLDEYVPSHRHKRKTQRSLISAGFSRTHDGNQKPDLNITGGGNSSHKRKQQSKLTDFNVVEADSTTTTTTTTTLISNSRTSTDQISTTNPVLSDPMLSIDVRVDGRLYRVPVPLSEMHSLTIKWLADEASKRYCRKECMKPTLELETKNGAALADDDVLNILFPLGSMQAEEVNARILKWNLPPLSERYKDACTNMNIDQNETLVKLLQDVTTILDLSDLYLRSTVLSPVCKVINRQSNLYHLNLSGNFILSENVQLLCTSLPSLESLAVLNLSLNHLDAESLNHMAKMFTESKRNILENLVDLDLSYNALRDDGLKYLGIITRHVKLRVLNLKSVDFTANIFNHCANRNVELYLEYLENFDVSLNRLDKNQVLKFMTWLKPNNVETLDVSRNNVTEEGLTTELIRSFPSLKRLNVSSCGVTDTEIYELISLLRLETLNLSYNANVSAISLRRLIQCSTTLLDLDLSGCESAMKYFESCADSTWTLPEASRLRSLRLSVDGKECNVLVNMWKNKYGDGNVMRLKDFLELSV